MATASFTLKLNPAAREVLQALYAHEFSPFERKIVDRLPVEKAFLFAVEGLIETRADPRLPLTRRHLRHALLQENRNQISDVETLQPIWQWFPFSKKSLWFDKTMQLPAVSRAKRVARNAVLLPFFVVFIFLQSAALWKTHALSSNWLSDLLFSVFVCGAFASVFFYPAVVRGLLKPLPLGALDRPFSPACMSPATVMKHTALNAYLNQTLTLQAVQQEYQVFLPLPPPVEEGGFLHKMDRQSANPNNAAELVQSLLNHVASLPNGFRSTRSLSYYSDAETKAEIFNELAESDCGKAFLAHVQHTQLKEKHATAAVQALPFAL